MTSSTPIDSKRDDVSTKLGKRESGWGVFRELGAVGCLALVLFGVFAVGLIALRLGVRWPFGEGSILVQLLITFVPGFLGVTLIAARAKQLVKRRYEGIDQVGEGKRWAVEASIGPVATAGGFKNWDLHLTKDMIFAVPTGMGASLMLGVAAGVEDVESMGDYPEPEIPTFVDTGNPKWRRYRVEDLERIAAKTPRVGSEELRLVRRGSQKADIYGILIRDRMDSYREILRSLYGHKYYEE